MKILHWSAVYLSYVTIEINYSDNARQGWDYDCSKFATLEDMKLNMAADFREPRLDWTGLMLFVVRNEETHSADLAIPPYTSGTDFMQYIFTHIEDMLTWQPAEIS